MRTDILVEDDEVTLIRTSDQGNIDVVTAPVERVRAAIEHAA